jgi:hypothetical protein
MWSQSNLARFLASQESAYMSEICVPAIVGGTFAEVAIDVGD